MLIGLPESVTSLDLQIAGIYLEGLIRFVQERKVMSLKIMVAEMEPQSVNRLKGVVEKAGGMMREG